MLGGWCFFEFSSLNFNEKSANLLHILLKSKNNPLARFCLAGRVVLLFVNNNPQKMLENIKKLAKRYAGDVSEGQAYLARKRREAEQAAADSTAQQ
jgi:ribosomal protein L10